MVGGVAEILDGEEVVSNDKVGWSEGKWVELGMVVGVELQSLV